VSGGAFNYDNYRLNDIADTLRGYIAAIRTNHVSDWGMNYGEEYSEEFLNDLIEAHDETRRLSAKLHNIDYVLSGDSGQESLRKNIAEDLQKKDQYEFDDPTEDARWVKRFINDYEIYP